MKSHIRYVKPNLYRLLDAHKAKNKGVVAGLSQRANSVDRNYRNAENCDSLGLVTLDELARELEVSIARFFVPPEAPEPKGYIACCFVRNLEMHIAKNGSSKAELCRKMGVSYNGVISTYLKYRSVPHMANLQALADSLGIEVIEFFSISNKEEWLKK